MKWVAGARAPAICLWVGREAPHLQKAQKTFSHITFWGTVAESGSHLEKAGGGPGPVRGPLAGSRLLGQEADSCSELDFS